MRHKTLAILVPLLVVFGAVGAYAWFSTTGTGSAQASSGTLGAPSITAASPGAGTVALTWSAVTPPASGTVTYYVSRDGGAPAGDCATSTAPSAATSCTDTGVSAGSHSYTVTAVWRSWTATSASTAVTVPSAAATHLVLAAATTTPTAGAADNLTITAKDAANNTVTSYAGDKSLTFGGATDTPDGTHPTVSDKLSIARNFGVSTTISFSSGTASVLGLGNGVMHLYKAETASITVTDGSINNTGLSIAVTPAAAASLSVSAYPSLTVAGVSHAFSATALDAFGNTATGYAGTVGFSASNDAQAVLPANSTLTAGTGSFNATFKTVGGGSKALTATDTVTASVTGSQSAITVSPAAAASLSVSGYPSSTVAGVSHALSVSALDAFGNTSTGYAGTIGFSASNDAQAVLPANSTLTAGTGSFDATFKTVAGGSKALTATDTVTTSITGSLSPITVTSAAAATLSVSGYPSPTVAGVSHTFSVTARDAFGNTATGYAGTVAFSASNDAQAVLPANSTLTAGTGSFNATFKTVASGSKALTATDTVTSSITGSQSGIAVTAASATIIAIVSGSGQSTNLNTAFASPLVASVSDTFGNPVAGASVTFAGPLSGASGAFASSGCTSNSPTSQCVATTAANGQATSSTFTANATAGAYNVSASASGTSSVNFSLTNNVALTFQVAVPSPQTAGTAFTATITAKSGASTDTTYTGTKCIVFSGPASSPSPSNSAPSYPLPGTCATGQSSMFFTSGVTTATMTLFRASASTTLTATQGAINGTSASFAVNSAGVAMSYTPSCPGPIAKSTTTTFTINVPNDAFSNPFTNANATGIAVGLALGNTTNFGFGTAVGTGNTTVNITTGPATNTFAVTASSASNKSTSLAMTSVPPGFTAPGSCVLGPT